MTAEGRRRPRPVGVDGDERTDARERALLLLYESASKGVSPAETVDAQVLRPDLLTRELVIGVAEHQQRIDNEIAAHAKGWTLQRMPLIDLTVMRIAAYELIGKPDVPVAVVLDEAVELAKRFSTDDSGRFVNGVLSALVPVLRRGPSTPVASSVPTPTPAQPIAPSSEHLDGRTDD